MELTKKIYINWLRRASRNGHARAQNRLAEIYDQGTGVPKSYKETLNLYTRVAHKGDNQAQSIADRVIVIDKAQVDL